MGRELQRRPPGALEADVLAALWAAGEPLTAAEVREQLAEPLAYTTVLTALSRLHDKGVVKRQPTGTGRAHAYEPVMDEAEHAASRMRLLLDGGRDRRAVLARFVGTLTPEDERTLASLVRRGRRRR